MPPPPLLVRSGSKGGSSKGSPKKAGVRETERFRVFWIDGLMSPAHRAPLLPRSCAQLLASVKTRLLGAVAPKADVKAPAGYGPSANVFEAETLLKSDGHARFRLSAPWHSQQPLHVPAVLRWRPARGRDNGEYVRGYLLYFQAARDGFAGAFVPLANCLRAGKGCIPNDTEALRWLREGAHQSGESVVLAHSNTLSLLALLTRGETL